MKRYLPTTKGEWTLAALAVIALPITLFVLLCWTGIGMAAAIMEKVCND